MEFDFEYVNCVIYGYHCIIADCAADATPAFLDLKKNNPDSQSASSCIIFFYDTFYERLFSVHPVCTRIPPAVHSYSHALILPQICRPLFTSGIKSQGKLLVKIVTMALGMLEDEKKFDEQMVALAENYYMKGIRAVEYGILGETLFWTLKKIVGTELYNVDMHMIWVRIYCRMLSVIVPRAVALEMADPNPATTRPIHAEAFVLGVGASSLMTDDSQQQTMPYSRWAASR